MKIDRTFEIITPESAEEGKVAEAGFLAEGTDCSFRSLAREVRDGCWEPSCWPLPADLTHVWLTQYGEADYATGEVENVSLHFAGKPREAKHWAKIVRLAAVRV